MLRILLMFLANFFRLPYMLYKLFHMTNNMERYSKEERYACLHRFVRWANWGGRVKVKVYGLENLPKDSNFIMFPNHQGLYDTLTMVEALDKPFSPVAKIETENVFLLGRVIKMLDGEFMDRADIRQSLGIINHMAYRAKSGETFVIFPEGTRSRLGNDMLPFKPGAFKSATLSHVPIVPVALVDSYVPFDRPSVKRTTVQLRILKPIYYEEYKDMKTVEIAKTVQNIIRNEIALAKTTVDN